jgi:hypothetical protein
MHHYSQEWGNAIKEYEDAVKRDPKEPSYHNNLAATLCKVGNSMNGWTWVRVGGLMMKGWMVRVVEWWHFFGEDHLPLFVIIV